MRFRPLAVAAWAVFLIDAAGIAWLAGTGWMTDDALGRSIALGVAGLVAAPVAILFAILALCTWWRSVIGMWICLALGSVPIILVLINIARHSA
ncbi:MAG TPA: hypothetical protein VFQ90_01055 [Stellaceae bacterium]|jgi:hypothetical protein|nr:hypothetical protein [Stellaceae bacterium]